MIGRPGWLTRLLGSSGRHAPTGAEVLRIVYESGSEFDPADPFGLCVLDLRSDGDVHLTTRRRAVERAYRATMRPGVLERVVRNLREGGFPGVPEHVVPAGPTRRLQVHTATGHQQTPPMAFHEAPRWPGYREAFHLLDSLVVAVSRGELPVVPDPEPDLTET
ncbi:MAG: hypothetical protein JNL54_11845 [Kineosporiaceae bacterium]|nr:hypothetical protein [Kineosporiaceae bacterium]